ncbi:MAG: universal stress protein [Deltaproteobacteria bacterium]|nr:universal stress protein [Deltaproteobacteria bacterium]
MKKVLLAIDGITPDQKVFQYAIQFCKRIKAELNVFQIINPRNLSEYLKNVRKGAKSAGGYFSSTMVAATFAEAGEHETAHEIMSAAKENYNRLLSETDKEGVPCHYSMKSGAPDKEIINYVNAHRNIVVAIYDEARHKNDKPKIIRKKKTTPGRIRQKLAIPLVVINS